MSLKRWAVCTNSWRWDGALLTDSGGYQIFSLAPLMLYCAGYTGYMWQMESGNSDDDSAINAYWVSGKIKPALVSLVTKALQLGLNLKEIISASTLNLSLQYRIDWNVSWTTAENIITTITTNLLSVKRVYLTLEQ